MQPIESNGSPWGNTSFKKKVETKQSLISIMNEEDTQRLDNNFDAAATNRTMSSWGNAVRSNTAPINTNNIQYESLNRAIGIKPVTLVPK